MLPIEGKTGKQIYSEMLLQEQEALIREKETLIQEKEIRRNAKAEMKGSVLQFTTQQMFIGVIIGCTSIVFTRMFISNIVIQVISFILLMACVVACAALRKTQDEKVDIIARTLVLLYIGMLLLARP